MNLAIVNSLLEEQIEEVKFVGKMRNIALRLARRHGFAGDPARYHWVAQGFWLLRYHAPLPSPTPELDA
jgi:hypothetical protein